MSLSTFARFGILPRRSSWSLWPRLSGLESSRRSPVWCRSLVGMPVSYVPEFVAKTESFSNPLRRSFLVKSLSDFAAGLENEFLLCPVRALWIYLDKTSSFTPLPHRLFLSPRRPSHSLSKNAILFFLREVIHEAGTSRPDGGPVRALSISGVFTSAAFHWNWSLSSVLESATWRSNSVFVSFYLFDLQHEFEGLRSLGPLWLRVNGSVRSHLFPLCAGGGEESSDSFSLCFSRFFILFWFCGSACPTFPDGDGVTFFFLCVLCYVLPYIIFFFFFFFFFFFWFLILLWVFAGLQFLWGLMTGWMTCVSDRLFFSPPVWTLSIAGLVPQQLVPSGFRNDRHSVAWPCLPCSWLPQALRLRLVWSLRRCRVCVPLVWYRQF